MASRIFWRCRECRSPVGVYIPTGAPSLRRAERHPLEAREEGGPPACKGSFTAPMTEAEHQADIDATQKWQAMRALEDQGRLQIIHITSQED
jgi:hypothetical protein